MLRIVTVHDGISVRLLQPGPESLEFRDGIWNVLEAVDREFVPPLSARPKSRLKKYEPDQEPAPSTPLWGAPIDYFDMVLGEHILLAQIDEEVVGFMSFSPHFTSPVIEQWSPCTYLSTTAVLPKFRRRGIATALNVGAESLPDEFADEWIVRRTWSTNEKNIALILSRGFKEVVRQSNDRGLGIDTIFYARLRNP